MSALEGLDDPHASEIALSALTAPDVETGRRRARGAARLGAAGNRHPPARSDHGDCRRSSPGRARSASPRSMRSPICPTIWFVRSASRRRRRRRPALRSTIQWLRANGSKRTAAKPRWPTLHDAIKTFRDSEARADTSRRPRRVDHGAGRRSPDAGRARQPAGLVRCPRDLQHRAVLRCRRDSSKPSDASATPVAWNRSRAPGRRHKTPAGAPSSRETARQNRRRARSSVDGSAS